MNIKSLMLGSAAALVAVTGARAADPIITPEPDPVEYVRVCDVYGTGFFYIPGTETCLRVSGYVRYRYKAVGEQRNFDNFDNYTAGSEVRGRVNFDAREETELGTLRGYVRLQGTSNFGGAGGYARNPNFAVPATGFPAGTFPLPSNSTFFSTFGAGSDGNDASVGLDEAYIQLGGLTMGYLDSLWATRDGLLTDTDWSVGDFQRSRVSYAFTADGFSAAVSLEDDGSGDFAPDVVGQIAYESGFFSGYVSGVYDEQREAFLFGPNQTRELFDGQFGAPNGRLDVLPVTINPLTGLPTFNTLTTFADPFGADEDDGAFAVKAGASLKNLIVEGSELKVEGHYAFDPTEYAANDIVTNFGSYGRQQTGIAIPIESQIGVGYSQAVGPFGVAVSAAFGETFDLFAADPRGFVPANGNTGILNLGSTEFYEVGLNVGYEITSNFSVLAEVTYTDLDLPDQFDDFDQTAGFVQFLREF